MRSLPRFLPQYFHSTERCHVSRCFQFHRHSWLFVGKNINSSRLSQVTSISLYSKIQFSLYSNQPKSLFYRYIAFAVGTLLLLYITIKSSGHLSWHMATSGPQSITTEVDKERKKRDIEIQTPDEGEHTKRSVVFPNI